MKLRCYHWTLAICTALAGCGELPHDDHSTHPEDVPVAEVMCASLGGLATLAVVRWSKAGEPIYRIERAAACKDGSYVRRTEYPPQREAP